jgi:hypothetical protein
VYNKKSFKNTGPYRRAMISVIMESNCKQAVTKLTKVGGKEMGLFIEQKKFFLRDCLSYKHDF